MVYTCIHKIKWLSYKSKSKYDLFFLDQQFYNIILKCLLKSLKCSACKCDSLWCFLLSGHDHRVLRLAIVPYRSVIIVHEHSHIFSRTTFTTESSAIYINPCLDVAIITKPAFDFALHGIHILCICMLNSQWISNNNHL